MEQTGALILAAGGSSRLGQPKQFLIHQGRTLIQHAVAAAAGCSPIVVVAGRERERIAHAIDSADISVVTNPLWERGIGSSIRTGVTDALKLAHDLPSLVILLGDQPFVTTDQVAALREAGAREKKPIIASSYSGTIGVPALFGRCLFSELLSLPDDRGAQQLILSHRDEIATIELPMAAIDIDTPADVIKYLSTKS